MLQVEKFVIVNHNGFNHKFRFKKFIRPWLHVDYLLGIDYLGFEHDPGEPLHILTLDVPEKTIHCLNDIEIPKSVLQEFFEFASMFADRDNEGKTFNIGSEVEFYYESDKPNPVGYDITHTWEDDGFSETYAYAVYIKDGYV